MGKEMITVAVVFNIRFGAARWTSEAAVWLKYGWRSGCKKGSMRGYPIFKSKVVGSDTLDSLPNDKKDHLTNLMN